MLADWLLAAGLGAVFGAAVTGVILRRRPLAPAPPQPQQPPPAPYDDERTQRVLGALPFAAFLVDSDGAIRFVNGAAVQLFRIDPNKAIGQAIMFAVPSVALERQILEAIDGATSTRDVTIADASRERTFGVTTHPFEGGALAVAADRTDLLAIEHVRREFVANVSHELRTPLSAMKLMIETMLVSDEDAEARAIFLPQAGREVDRMIRLVEDLLELARSESGNVVLRREIFDLSDVASSVVSTFSQRSATLGIALELEAPEAVFADADRNRLTQVALNLVDNALRHTPQGGSVVVEIARSGADALLTVRDTGRGIPFNDLPHIFERFYVVDRSRSREHTGTGLGLSIARHLVEAHGGSLTASSVYGRGSTFTMRIPAVEMPANLKVG